MSQETYSELFQAIDSHLEDMVLAMGPLELNWRKPGEIRYDMTHQHGAQTLKFGVFFIQEDDGQWKILRF